MKIRTSMTRNILATLLVVPLAATVSAQEKETTTQKMKKVDEQSLEWLRDIQSNTVQIADHAAKLQIMSRDPITYDEPSHEFELLKIQNRINAVGDLVPRLKDRADAPEWQREILDEVASLLAAMGAQTERALEFVRDVPVAARLNSNRYEARLAGIGLYARHINELVNYADARVEAKRLREQALTSSS